MTEFFPTPSVDLISALEEFALFLDDDPSESEESEGPEDDLSSTTSTHLDSLDQVGVIPSWQQIQITLRDVSYNFITGREKDEKVAKLPDAALNNKEHKRDTAEIEESSKESIPKVTQTEIENDTSKGSNYTSDEPSLIENTSLLSLEQADSSADFYEGNGDEDEDEDEDEIEEIGRLPTFHQLQFTLRNASKIISSSMFGSEDALTTSELPDFIKPPDLLKKWGGPLQGGGLGWYSFMQNFQIPSFLGDESSDDDEPVNIDENPELYSEENITDEDRTVLHNHEGLTGCPHYLRLCKSECNICHKYYVCQICHDEVETHEMDRRKVRKMLCLNCKRPQPPNRKCVFCKEVMGDYYCDSCKLWSDDPEKPIYHCDECNICRVGRGHGIDTFHCEKCGICMALTVKDNHKCIEKAANSGCPICLEDLFSSTKPTVFMPCGHPIHSFCFKEYTKRYYRCPICAKSIFDTSALFRMVDEEIRCEVLPPELANKRVPILCQDCHLKSRTDFHLAGLKCETCGSYNTAQL